MPKGKKFTAAEKHFLEKQQRYEKEIKTLTARISEQSATISQQEAQIERLTVENQQLQAQIQKLLQYTELSPDDIKAACERDKKTAETASLITNLFRMSGMPY